MLEENRTPTRQFIERGDVHHSGESASEAKKLRTQLLDCRKSPCKIDKGTNAIFIPLSTQSEMQIQSMREVSERKLARSTEENVTSE